MKKSQLKRVIKPIVEECINEVLLEEGVLSNIVSEVAIGLQNQRIVTEGVTVTKNTEDLEAKAERLERQRQEKIKKLNESSKLGGVFTGTTPLVESSGQGPLAGTSPTDAGVDITAIQQIANGKWKHLIK